MELKNLHNGNVRVIGEFQFSKEKAKIYSEMSNFLN